MATVFSHNDGNTQYHMLRLLDKRLATMAPRGAFHVSANIANPAALGLLGFATTTALLQGSITGISGVTTASWAVAFGFFYGGLAQLVAGVIEFFRQAMFPAVAFSTYGAFWMSFSIYSVLTKTSGTGGQPILTGSYNGEQMMLFIFALITFTFWICTFTMNVVLNALFFTLAWLFVLLGVGVDHHTWHQVAGWLGLVVSGIAFYGAAATLVNDSFNRVILPLGFFRKQQHLQDPEEPDMLNIPQHQWVKQVNGGEANGALQQNDVEIGSFGSPPTDVGSGAVLPVGSSTLPVSSRMATVP